MATGKQDSRITAVLNEVKHWETMPNRSEPLTIDMISYQQLKCRLDTPHAKEATMYNWEVFDIYAGPHHTKWAQRDGNGIVSNINETAKAFLINDFQFHGENRCHMSCIDALQNPHLVHTIDVTWRFQKNGENGEKKTFVHAFDNPSLCAVSTLLRIAQHRRALNLSEDHPLVVYTSDSTISGNVQLIWESSINAALQSTAGAVYNITKEEELAHFTSHSIRVSACVALHAANISVLNIKQAL